ncbi:MAG: DUF917 family protein [Pseudohongiellaceae bacterium]|jgi:DUF917 family protein
MKEICAEDIKDLCAGAAFLATGGGGDPYVSQLIAERLLTRYGPAKLMPLDQVPDDFHVVSIGMVGAPTVTLEQLPTEDEAVKAFDAYQTLTGKKIDAVIPFEVGGGNSTIPLTVAAMRNVPCIDGDGMGRALPEAQMMTFPIYGVHPTPAVLRDAWGNQAILYCNDAETFERHVRAMAVTMGGMITSAEHGMTGKQARTAAIPQTISFATALGKLLRAHDGIIDAIEGDIVELFKATDYGIVRRLYTGKVVDNERKIVGGYDVGSATIQSFDANVAPMTLLIKNEYLIAKVGEKVVATVPDLICIVEQETSLPLNAERMRYGQRVTVFGIGCTHHYQTDKALKVTSPRAFGFDLDYVPLAELERAQ